METFFLIGVAQGIFFTVILLSKKDNRTANSILALWLILISISLLLNYSYFSGIIKNYPHLIGLNFAFPFLYGPFLYLYTKQLTQNERFYINKNWFHFLPFLCYLIYLLVLFYLKSAYYKLEFLERTQHGILPNEIQIFNFAKFLQAIVYICITLILLKKHKIRIENEFSTLHKINLYWLSTIIWCVAAVYGVKLISVFIFFVFNITNINKIVALTDLSVIIFVYVITFFGYKQPQIFSYGTPINEEKDNIVAPANEVLLTTQNIVIPKPKYYQSTLTADRSKMLLDRLLSLMQTEKPYLNPNITIADIAEKLEISTKELSQIINEQLNKNFFNFVNEYRIEEVKNRLIDKKYDHLSILGIAFESGFNSKSAFNNVFKRFTNQTPTDYISETS